MKKNKQFSLNPFTGQFAVDPENMRLTDVVLLEANREASGHGFYIDPKTLQTALESINEKGGKLKAYYTHDHRGAGASWWANMIEDSKSELDIPGYFSDFRVDGDKLIAGEFQFFDYFARAHPTIVAQVIEMAAKTPSLIMQSIEFWGYGVYVDEDGNEYQEAPEDTELQYNGMPAVRVVEMFASAFVADGAATSGMFAKLSRKLKGDAMEEIRDTLSTWKDEILSEIKSGLTTNDKDMNTLEQIKSRFGADEPRMLRALKLHVDNPDLKIAEIEFRLKEEDRETEVEQLRAKAAEADQLKTALEKANEKVESLKTTGFEPGKVPASDGRGVDPDQPTFLSFDGKVKKAIGMTAKVAVDYAAKGIQFAVTAVSDLWVPEVWVEGMPEAVTTQTDLLTSAVVVTDPKLNAIASGGGVQGNMPFFQEPDFPDAPQVASTAPAINNIDSGNQIVPILNRVSSVGSDALAPAVSASDPIGFAQGIAARLRLRQRLTTLLSMLNGLFAEGATGAAFKDLVAANFDEDGAIPAADNMIDSDMFADATSLLGEKKSRLEYGGVILMHSVIETALIKQDAISVIRDSEGKIIMKEYKGLRVIVNDSLVRDGATSGKVYYTYVFAPRSVGMGDKPQSNRVGDVASLQVEGLASTNDVVIYDRTRSILAPFGSKWVGTPAGQSASNTELATKTNWQLAFGDVKNVGVLQIVTNK